MECDLAIKWFRMFKDVKRDLSAYPTPAVGWPNVEPPQRNQCYTAGTCRRKGCGFLRHQDGRFCAYANPAAVAVLGSEAVAPCRKNPKTCDTFCDQNLRRSKL